jgi:hypothetical protein
VKLRLAERLTERLPDRSSGLAESAPEAGREAAPAPVEGCVCGCVCGTGPLGSAAFAFGMIENLSWKLCAAAGFTCIPIHADNIRIPILEGTRIIASQKVMQINKCSGRRKFRAPQESLATLWPHRSKFIFGCCWTSSLLLFPKAAVPRRDARLVLKLSQQAAKCESRAVGPQSSQSPAMVAVGSYRDPRRRFADSAC